MKIMKEIIQSNMKRIEEDRKAAKMLIPESMLSGLKERGQNGKPVFRGRKSASSK